MDGRRIYVETAIAADVETVWRLTQDPVTHARWDIRFSRIDPDPESESDATAPTRFRYERRTPLHTVLGTGVSLGERRRADGTRTSALRFHTRDRLSPIRAGRGFWRYVPDGDRTVFLTGYDYTPGWGPLDLIVRPLLGWATAWSFDRLRIWIETGVPPERWPLVSIVWWWRRDRPRAARCARTPTRARRESGVATAPATLDTLPDPKDGP